MAEQPSAPVYLCDEPDDCQGHHRRCTHTDGLMACVPCVKQRTVAGLDWCRTDDTDGLPLPLDAYRGPPEAAQCVMAECDNTVEPGRSFYCTFHAVSFGRQSTESEHSHPDGHDD